MKKSDNSKNLSEEETVDKKLSEKRKASEVLEEVYLKCDNCGKNFTSQGLKDHCDQTLHNLPKFHQSKCYQCNYQNMNDKGLKKHQMMKHNSSQY